MLSTTTHLVHVDPELAGLIPRFLAHRRQDLDQLRAAVAGGDFAAARRIGHTLKGVGGGYGFRAITQFGGAIERAAGALDADELARLTAQYAAYLDGVEVTFE